MRSLRIFAIILVAMLAVASFSFAFTEKAKDTAPVQFRDQNLGARSLPRPLSESPFVALQKSAWSRFARANGTSFSQWSIHIDDYTGLPAGVNGPGLPWLVDGQVASNQELDALGRKFIAENSALFGNLSTANLELNGEGTGQFGENNYLAYIDYHILVRGVQIEGADLIIRLNHGRMVQFGIQGVLPSEFASLNHVPVYDAQHAQGIAFSYAGGFDNARDTLMEPGKLVFMPRITDSGTMTYQLIWKVIFHRQGEPATWTAHVDANTGQLVEFWNSNDYGQVEGGAYPSGPANSTETILPFPFADVGGGAYTNSCGIYTQTTGTVTSALNGQYVKMVDTCGAISLSGAAPATLNFGSGTGTDCSVPTGNTAGPGNTHASRTGFYHVNRTKEKARAWLPSNTWLTQQLTTNMNLNQTCNAYWNGSTLNFFKSGGGCNNTGEISSVFLHEFGHGLDQNDGDGTADNGTGEAYGDTNAFLQSHLSCIGPGFLGSNCGGYGDACTSCTGVRDVDYAKHSSNAPATIAGYVQNNCTANPSYAGPCGREGHCESEVTTEATWDLANRDLPGLGYDATTSWYIVDRLFYLSRPTAGSAYSCNNTNWTASGCAAANWHEAMLVVDDDDGNLTNGTPHASALMAAFARHGISCATATSTNSTTCGSIAAPSPSASSGNNQVTISWPAVSGAAKYYVMRNDLSCTAGYLNVTGLNGTTGTSYTDTTVANGFTEYYRVIAVGSNASCFSPMSSTCLTVTPSAGPDFSISANPTSLTINQGASGTSTITIGALNGFTGTVSFSTTGLPSGVTDLYTPATVTGSGSSTLTLTASSTAATGTSTITVTGTSGSTTHSTTISLTVNNPNAPPALTATYNSTYKAPACGSGGKSCDSGTTLLNGRDTITGGNEPNQPNTINSSCADGTSGTYHSDESNDRLQVATNDGSALAGGKAVTVTATVWCWGTADSLDLYYTSSIPGTGSPTWTLIRTQACTVAGQAVNMTGTYTLPTTGTVHAIRANYRYQGSASSCSTGAYDDHDDLVFGVSNTPDTTPPTTSITSPTDGSTVSGTITISATASDNVGVTNVEFYRGTTLIGSDSTSPYSISWDTTTVANGSYSLTSKAYDAAGNSASSTPVNVTVNNVGGPPDLTATYNSTYKAPTCGSGGKSCDTGASLVNGRGTMSGGNETNRPNTINNSCVDGNSGTYHVDESIDRVRIATNDGTAFAAGKAVTITYTVYCYSSADSIDIYRTASIPGTGSPTWTLIGTQACTAAGVRTFTAGYTLPSGATQAVRGQFRYLGSAGTCTSGSYNDRDDLVFGVQ